jgi:hypothetical protein
MMRAASPQPQGQHNQPPRARSPAPGMIPRAVSPQPQHGASAYQPRSRSPAPGMMPRAASPNPMMQQGQGRPGSQQYRAASPNPYGRPRPGPGQGTRQSSGMEMQLSSQDVTRYDGSGGGSGRNRQNMMRPNSSFGGDRYSASQQYGGQQSQGYDRQQPQQRGGAGMDVELRRERSKSLASIPYRPAGNGQPEPQRILHYGKSFSSPLSYPIFHPPLTDVSGANSTRNVYLHRRDSRGAVLHQGRRPRGTKTARRWMVGGRDQGEQQGCSGQGSGPRAEQLSAEMLDSFPTWQKEQETNRGPKPDAGEAASDVSRIRFLLDQSPRICGRYTSASWSARTSLIARVWVHWTYGAGISWQVLMPCYQRDTPWGYTCTCTWLGCD